MADTRREKLHVILAPSALEGGGVVGVLSTKGSLLNRLQRPFCSKYITFEMIPLAMKAGDIIPVRFWTSDMTYSQHITELPKKSYEEARHGGGLCEFSLSYDGGKSFHVIATYTKTCPDVLYRWPVRIPDNVPSCKESGKKR